MYDPHDYLAEDLIRLMLAGYDTIAIFHLRVRGTGKVVVDLVEEMLEQGQFYLPEQSCEDFRQVKELEQLEEMVSRWSNKMKGKENAKRLVLY